MTELEIVSLEEWQTEQLADEESAADDHEKRKWPEDEQ